MWGPVDHALARLALLGGEPRAAASWFDQAARQAIEAPLVLARIEADRAERATHLAAHLTARLATRRRRPADRAAS